MSSVQKWPGGGSGWLIELVDSNYINIYVYNSLAEKFIHIIAWRIDKFKERFNHYSKQR